MKYSRPDGHAKLNQHSPLADGLVFWFAGNRPAPTDIISGRALTPSGTPPTFVRSVYGSAWQFAATYFLSTWTPVTAGPYTVTAWYSYTASAIRDVVSIANASTDADFVQMQAIGNTAKRPVRLRIGDSGGTTTPNSDITTLGHQQSVWGHGAIVIQNPTARAVYANGRHKTTNAVSRTPTGLSRIGIGVQAQLTLASTFTGFISDVCIWNRVLSDGEILSLYQPETRWQLYEQKQSIWVVGAATTAPQTVNADAIASTAQVFQPAITTGAVTVALGFISSTAIVYAPLVQTVATQTVYPNTIVSVAMVFQVLISQYTASAERTYTVPFENRSYAVPIEVRTFIVAAESRTYTVPGA